MDEVLEAATPPPDIEERLLQLGKGFENEPAIERLIDHPAVLPKVRALLGERFVLQAAWCTVQPAGSQSVGWHQDGSSAFDFKQLGYPVPLVQLRASYHLNDQSEPFMGNMMMIPGSLGSRLVLPAAVRREVHACPVQQILCARRGGVLLFHNGVYHSPMPNNRDYDRYNMHLSTARPGFAVQTGTRQIPNFWSARHPAARSWAIIGVQTCLCRRVSAHSF
jgi:ectoine hydroxylase-related dioxygenase (phytanoyl-CoA dioxygenase family)